MVNTINPTLSIIVPIYNVEEYLVRCVDSILNQPYSDFELILIDDGSPDKCGSICDDYAIKDERIVVIHKKNGGLSSARNAGIDIARGNYLSFIDSDDFISEDFYKPNMNCLLSNSLIDMIVMQVCHYNGGTNLLITNEVKKYNNNHDVKDYLLSMNYICSSWINIYKIEVFKSIRFPEGQIFEDGFLLPDIADRVNNLYVSDVGIYYYRKRTDSIMSKNRTESNWRDILLSHVRILDYCYKYPDDKKRFLERYKGFSLSLIYSMIEFPNGSFHEFLDVFQRYQYSLRQLLKINASIKDKVKLFVFKKIGYRSVVKIYKYLNLY